MLAHFQCSFRAVIGNSRQFRSNFSAVGAIDLIIEERNQRLLTSTNSTSEHFQCSFRAVSAHWQFKTISEQFQYSRDDWFDHRETNPKTCDQLIQYQNIASVVSEQRLSSLEGVQLQCSRDGAVDYEGMWRTAHRWVSALFCLVDWLLIGEQWWMRCERWRLRNALFHCFSGPRVSHHPQNGGRWPPAGAAKPALENTL